MNIAALFPGQNSHAVGMGTEMAQAYSSAAEVFSVAKNTLAFLPEMMAQGPIEELTLTANQQPALVTASIAAYKAWQEATGLQIQCAAGHSLGEFSAHVAVGTLTLPDALSLVHQRGRYMQQAVPVGVGAMAAIMGGTLEGISEVCQNTPGVVEVANINSPAQVVISGEAGAVKTASETLKTRGAKVIPLKVSAPFHCSLMQPARDLLATDLAQTAFLPMQCAVVANVTAQPVQDSSQVAQLLAEQVTGTVRWVECVHTLASMGVDEFIEFGSGTVLTGLLKKILPEAKFYNIHTPADIQKYREAHA